MSGSKRRKKVFIGLTGGPGVGKSEVAQFLKDFGASVIIADRIGHDLLSENKSIRSKLIKLLGANIVSPDRTFDRRAIGAAVFSNPGLMAEFNSIMHPPLLGILKKEMLEKARGKRSKMIVVDAALIFEWGIADWFDYILVVNAKRERRIKRMVKQGLSKSRAIKRIASQIPQRDKVALADYVIENNSSLKVLKSRVREFAERLKQQI